MAGSCRSKRELRTIESCVVCIHVGGDWCKLYADWYPDKGSHAGTHTLHMLSAHSMPAKSKDIAAPNDPNHSEFSY